METLTNYHASYQEFKQALDTEMKKTVEGFVKIGFLLNFATETNILEEGGYSNVNDFAKAEYGIDATQVSRFVNIYKRFGVDGEPRLKDQYSSHGVAKLGIMLTLPDCINEEISESYSKSEITAIKREVEAEEKISDIEVEIEKAEMQDSVQYTLPEGLKQVVYQMVHDYPEVYARSYASEELDQFKEIVVPMGEITYFVRIKGVGRIAVFLKTESNVTLTNIRENSKEEYGWQQLFDAFKEYFKMGTDAKESWCNVFQEPWPVEEKKAEEKVMENASKPHKDNVQQAKPKKESKVKTPEPKKENTPAKSIESVESGKQMDEQLPGQDNIMNHPEYLPEEMQKEVLTGEVENITADASQIKADEIYVNTDKDNVQQAHEGMKVEYIAPVQNNDSANVIRGYKAGIRAALTIMEDKYEQGDWSSLYTNASNIAFRAKKLMELEGKNV